MHHVGWAMLVGVLVGCSGGNMVGPSPVPPSRWTPTTDDRQDALNYFLGTRTTEGVGNVGETRTITLDWEGDNARGVAYWVKTPHNPGGPSYEVYEWDTEWIYLREDRSHGGYPDYGFTLLRWMPRRIQPGWAQLAEGNQLFVFTEPGACEVATLDMPICPPMVLNYQHGPDCRRPFYTTTEVLGVDGDILSMRFAEAETFHYSWEWGWVGWDHSGFGVQRTFPQRGRGDVSHFPICR